MCNDLRLPPPLLPLLPSSFAIKRMRLTSGLKLLISLTNAMLACITRKLSARCKPLSLVNLLFNASTDFSKYSCCRAYSLVISMSSSPVSTFFNTNFWCNLMAHSFSNALYHTHGVDRRLGPLQSLHCHVRRRPTLPRAMGAH